MTTSYIYGPRDIAHYGARIMVYDFDVMPEPWKGHAMMLDAAANSAGRADLGFCSREQMLFDNLELRIWYMFDLAFWTAARSDKEC